MPASKTLTFVWFGSSIADNGGRIFHDVVVATLKGALGCDVKFYWEGYSGSPTSHILHALKTRIGEIKKKLGVVDCFIFEGGPNSAYNDRWFYEEPTKVVESTRTAAELIQRTFESAKIILLVHAPIEGEGLLAREVEYLEQEKRAYKKASEGDRVSITSKYRDRVAENGSSLRPISGKEGQPRIILQMFQDLYKEVLKACTAFEIRDPRRYTVLDMWSKVNELDKPHFFDHIHWNNKTYQCAAKEIGGIFLNFLSSDGKQDDTGSTFTSASQATVGPWEIHSKSEDGKESFITVATGLDNACTAVSTQGTKYTTLQAFTAVLKGDTGSALLLQPRPGEHHSFEISRPDLEWHEKWTFDGYSYDPDALPPSIDHVSLKLDPGTGLFTCLSKVGGSAAA